MLYDASFASKLVATVNPSLPPFDSYNLEHAQLKKEYGKATRAKNHESRLKLTIEVNDKYFNRMYEFLESKNGKYLVTAFKKKFTNYHITEIKMVDLVLWQIRS